jgi:flagellar biosynthesis/type III secretory pathway chaperone
MQREKCRQRAAKKLGQAETAGFATLIPLMPADYQPLVKALVDENNELLVRVQQRARQNHLLLSRSVELMQGFLNTLFAAQETRVYDEQGGVQKATAAPRSLYEGVG